MKKLLVRGFENRRFKFTYKNLLLVLTYVIRNNEWYIIRWFNMMKGLLVRGFEYIPPRTLGFGDLILYYTVCIFKCKELECDEVHTFRPQCGTSGTINAPDLDQPRKTFYLPIVLHERDEILKDEDFDIVLDISKPNMLFPGHREFRTHFWETQKYLNYYYMNIDKDMEIYIERELQDKPYIVFHWRSISQIEPERNSSIDDFKSIVKLIKHKYGDKYEYWKCGEPCEIDEEFDYIIPPMWDDIDGYTKIVRNCSLLISAHSGIQFYGWHFKDVPVITYGSVWKWTFANPQRWRFIVGNEFGDFLGLWLDDQNQCVRFKQDEYDASKLEKFLNSKNL